MHKKVTIMTKDPEAKKEKVKKWDPKKYFWKRNSLKVLPSQEN